MQKKMLTKFKVENFKSIHSLELELGRMNVFIGENGSGKSNVLEAVALASAAIMRYRGNVFKKESVLFPTRSRTRRFLEGSPFIYRRFKHA
jgi:AAA15 family ATPase/GTPase